MGKKEPLTLGALERKLPQVPVSEPQPETAADPKVEALAKTLADKALAARKAGRRVFQVALPLSKTSAFVVPMVTALTLEGESGAHGLILDAIEAQGWRLEHAGYVFRITGSKSRDKFFSSGQQEAVSGEIVGIYIFRVAEPK